MFNCGIQCRGENNQPDISIDEPVSPEIKIVEVIVHDMASDEYDGNGD